MARCNCSARSCECVVVAGAGVAVTGSGSAANPFTISAEAGGTGTPAPTGAIMGWGGSAAAVPAGWIMCDGQLRNVVDFPALYAVIGNTWGGVPNVSFNVPPLTGRFPVGAGTVTIGTETRTFGFGNLGGVAGGRQTLTVANLPPHTHGLNNHRHHFDVPANNFTSGNPAGTDGGAHTHNIAHDHAFAHDHGAANTGAANPGTGTVAVADGTAHNVQSSVGTHQHTFNVPPWPAGAGRTGNPAPNDTPNGGGHTHAIRAPAQNDQNTTTPYNVTQTENNDGSNTMASASFDIVPPWAAIRYIIKT